MWRLFEFLVAVDNKLLDLLFQPIVALSPERTRAKPAMIGFFVLAANAIWLTGTIIARMLSCRYSGPFCWNSHTSFREASTGMLLFAGWMGMSGGNQSLMQLSVQLCSQQRPGRANWFREGGVLFRYPFLIGAIIITLWSTWQTGPAFWLWWAGTCFMGCNSMPPREPFWIRLRQWAHA